jgi:hypothetical protein
VKRLVPAIALVCVAVPAAPASAATTTFRFHAGTERARVSVSDGRTAERGYIELVRSGMVIARSAERNGLGAAGGHVKIPSLVAGDVVRVYANGALLTAATYDGRPAIGGACHGRSSFTVTRSESARTTWVGVRARRVLWADARTYAVAVSPALRAGLTASAITTWEDGTTAVISRRDLRVGNCRTMPPPARVPPTDAELRRAARRAVVAAGARLRRARLGRSVTLPFRCLEPGSVQFELRAGRTVLGSGVTTVAERGEAKVKVKLTAAARRARRLTLIATFAPARADAGSQSARTTFRRP